jgi:glycosyltransferase involved in cell wall biosynthesis
MKVSVVIPTYNRAALLLEAIDSVLSQRFDDLEIIVVDDGSRDDTGQRIRQYADKVVYVRQANAGVNAARNRALGIAQGEYVALLDDDDLWLDSKLELQVQLLDRHQQAGFVFSDFLIRKDTGEVTPRGLSTWHHFRRHWSDVLPVHSRFTPIAREGVPGSGASGFDVYSGDIYHASLFEPYVLPSTALIRRRCIDPDLRLVESDPTCGDWEFFTRLSHRYGAIYMDVATTVNRSHDDEFRLTRLPAVTQIRRRLAMIDRVWSADPGFCNEHRSEVEGVKSNLLVRLAKHQARSGDISGARDSLRQGMAPGAPRLSMKDTVIAGLILCPGASGLLRLAQSARVVMSRK